MSVVLRLEHSPWSAKAKQDQATATPSASTPSSALGSGCSSSGCSSSGPATRRPPCDYWLVHRGAAEQKTPPTLRALVGLARARWRIEQDYREFKEELGLDHLEGRS